MSGGNTGYARGDIAITICDRCGRKAKYRDMIQDHAKKGVWLHSECADRLSPWQLPMQVQDNYVLMRPRPDAYLTYNTYVVNDNSPVLLANSLGTYPAGTYAAGTTYENVSVLLDSTNNDPLQSGPDLPVADQRINSYIPPSQR